MGATLGFISISVLAVYGGNGNSGEGNFVRIGLFSFGPAR